MTQLSGKDSQLTRAEAEQTLFTRGNANELTQPRSCGHQEAIKQLVTANVTNPTPLGMPQQKELAECEDTRGNADEHDNDNLETLPSTSNINVSIVQNESLSRKKNQ